VLDTAEDAVNQAETGLDVARKQYELTKAGAWSYDIVIRRNLQGAQPSLRGGQSVAGEVFGQGADRWSRSVGLCRDRSYVSSQGAYDPYTAASTRS